MTRTVSILARGAEQLNTHFTHKQMRIFKLDIFILHIQEGTNPVGVLRTYFTHSDSSGIYTKNNGNCCELDVTRPSFTHQDQWLKHLPWMELKGLLILKERWDPHLSPKKCPNHLDIGFCQSRTKPISSLLLSTPLEVLPLCSKECQIYGAKEEAWQCSPVIMAFSLEMLCSHPCCRDCLCFLSHSCLI